MVDQPGAGNSNTYKIRGYSSRQRHTAKPYARPSGRKKGVLETVRDFLAPSWLVGWFQKKETVSLEENIESRLENDRNEFADGDEQTLNQEFRSPTVEEHETCTSIRKPINKVNIGNGQVPSAKGTFATYSYYTPSLQRQKLLNELPFTSVETTSETFETRETKRGICEENEQNERFSLAPDVTTTSMTDKSVREPGVSRYLIGDEDRTGLDYSALQDTMLHQLNKPRRESSIKKLSTSRLVSSHLGVKSNSSPFYPGKTSYGGASANAPAFKRMRMSSGHGVTPPQTYQPMKMQVKPKPVTGVSNTGVTSQTAKRILESLEKMSSPLIDAKKVPHPPSSSPSDSPLSFVPSKRKAPTSTTSRTVGSPRSLKVQFSAPPVGSLSTPKRATISKIRPKELEESRVVTSSSQSALPLASSVVSVASQSTALYTKPIATFTSTPLPMSLSPVTSSHSPKGGGKMKAPRNTGHYSLKEREVEEEEIVNPLPEVTSAVPLNLASGKNLPSFNFGISAHSTPMPSNTTKATLFPKPDDKIKNNFKFSAPATKVPSTETTKKKNLDDDVSEVKFSFSQPVPVSRSGTEESDSAVSEKQKNVVKNSVSAASDEAMKKVGPSVNSWECDTCLINNKASENKCIACSAPKPRVKPAGSKTSQVPALGLKKFTSSNDTTANDLLKKFVPPAGLSLPRTEQSGPAVAKGNSISALSGQDANNNSDLVKRFAPAAGAWTCDTCMINNDSVNNACAACSTPKPGVKPPSSQNVLNGGNFKLGAGNSNSIDTNKVSLPFTFGASDSSSKDSPISGFKFGEQTSAVDKSESLSKVTYTFGTGSSDSTSSKGVNNSNMTAPTSFTFGATTGAGKKDESGSKSIAQAAAEGLLKIPAVQDAEKATSAQGSQTKPSSIAEAASLGLLKVPEVGEKKEIISSPPNVNLFCPTSASQGMVPTPTQAKIQEKTCGNPNVSSFSFNASTTVKPESLVITKTAETSNALPGFMSSSSPAAGFSFIAPANNVTLSLSSTAASGNVSGQVTTIAPINEATPAATQSSLFAGNVSAGETSKSTIGASTTPFAFKLATTSSSVGSPFLATSVAGLASSTTAPSLSDTKPAFSFAASTGPTLAAVTPAFQFGASGSNDDKQKSSQPFQFAAGGSIGSTQKSSSQPLQFGSSTGSGDTAKTASQSFQFAAAVSSASTTKSTAPQPFQFGSSTGSGDTAKTASQSFPFAAAVSSGDTAKTTSQPFQFAAGGSIGSTAKSTIPQQFQFSASTNSGDTAKTSSQPFQFGGAMTTTTQAFPFSTGTNSSETTKTSAQAFQFGASAGSKDAVKPNPFSFSGTQSTGSQPFMFAAGGNNTAAPAATAASDEVMDADGNNAQASVTPFAFGAKTGNTAFGAGAISSSNSVFGSGVSANASGTTPAFGAGTTNTSLSAFGSATTQSNPGFAFGSAQTTPGGFNFGGSQQNSIIFEAERGDGYLGDFAIDDISLRAGACKLQFRPADEKNRIKLNPCNTYCEAADGIRNDIAMIKLKDGTRCYDYDNPHDICLRGSCIKFGCDNKMDSSKKTDECGVCGGTGSSCTIVKGTVKIVAEKEYEKVMQCPVGTTNIFFEESVKSSNFLSIQILEKNSRPSLNGDDRLWKPGRYRIAGTKFIYSIDEQGKESLKAIDAIQKPIIITVKRGAKPNAESTVTYKFSKPKSAITVEYNWTFGSWSHCSKTCGPGIQKRSYLCARKHDNLFVNERFCRFEKKPPAPVRKCERRPCVFLYKWILRKWRRCSKTCGGGYRYRSIRCIELWRNVTVGSSHCRKTMKVPLRRTSCNKQPCPSQWHAEKWGECSVTCGKGNRSRNVTCLDHKRTLSKKCNDTNKPPTTEECHLDECGNFTEKKQRIKGLSCSFENGFCKWSNVKRKDDFDFKLGSGRTPSDGTGPRADNTLKNRKGKYVYIEGSSPRRRGDTAQLISPKLNVSSACISFFYHMFGEGIGRLSLYVKTSKKSYRLFFRYGNKGGFWNEAAVSVSTKQAFQIVFEAVRGRSFRSDICLDDIVVETGKCRRGSITTEAKCTDDPSINCPGITQGGKSNWCTTRKYKIRCCESCKNNVLNKKTK